MIKIAPMALPLAMLLGGPRALAANPKEDLVSVYQSAKLQVVTDEKEERSILGSLYSINQRMKSMSKHRGRLTDRALLAESDVRQLAKVINDLERKIDHQRGALSSRLKALYMLNGQGALRILFSAQSSQEFDRNLKFLRLVTDRDYVLIKDYERNLRSLKNKKTELRNRVERLARVQMQLRKQEGLLTHEQESKSGLLSRLKASRDANLAKMHEIRAQGVDRLKTNIDQFDTAFFEKRGAVGAPISASVLKGYGFVQNEQYRFRLSHKGLFFKATNTDIVRAVAKGRVAYCGELDGYGRTVIIDHGDHYYTVYGYLSSLSANQGDVMAEGQTLGFAGGPSPQFGAGLYFEIRHFSDAIDPQSWIKGVGEMTTSQL